MDSKMALSTCFQPISDYLCMHVEESKKLHVEEILEEIGLEIQENIYHYFVGLMATTT
jgi:hypothetical protein